MKTLSKKKKIGHKFICNTADNYPKLTSVSFLGISPLKYKVPLSRREPVYPKRVCGSQFLACK